MPEQPDIIADYDQLVSALRERIDKLAISQQLIDDLAGWAGGYAGKVLGPSEVKRMSTDSLFILLETLGLGLQLVENPAALARMEARYERRVERTRRTGVIRRHISAAVREAVVHEHVIARATNGGHARAACLPSKQRVQIARKAARARWDHPHNRA